MINEDPFKKKISLLQPWMSLIVQAIKKEIKNEHLRKESGLVQKYFQKKAIEKLNVEELSEAYFKEIALEGNEEAGEWLTTRWVLKHAELYQFFAGELTKINPKFDEIAQIPSESAQLMLRYSVNQFGATTTYIFSILNSVMFAEEDYLKLREAALKELETKVIDEESALPQETVEEIKSRYEKEIQKLTGKYEKRLQGVERKYFQDVEGLRKQISQLHKKIGEMCASAVR